MIRSERKTKASKYILPVVLDTILTVITVMCLGVALLGIWQSIENGPKQRDVIDVVVENGFNK